MTASSSTVTPRGTAARSVGLVMASNLVAMLASALVVLLLPKSIGVEAYSHFQLFLFYGTFVGFTAGGWADGVYLRYGGEYFERLPVSRLSGQLRWLVATQLVIAAAVAAGAAWLAEPDRLLIWQATAAYLVLANARVFCLYLLQATARAAAYSLVMIVDRAVYVAAVALGLLAHIGDFRWYIGGTLAGAVVSLALGLWLCRQVVTADHPWRITRTDRAETAANLSAGVGLMAASVTSLLIVGTVRFAIEHVWGVVAFGKISLVLNLLTVVVSFLNAVGVVFFPLLRRADPDRWVHVYQQSRMLLMAVLLASLLGYFPMRWAVDAWLPQYRDAIAYLPVLFPVLVFESKQAIVSNTFFKAMRHERLMLAVNAAAMLLSAAVCAVTAGLLHDFTATVCAIPAVVAARSIISDVVIDHSLGLRGAGQMLLELASVAVFVAATMLLLPVVAVAVTAAMLTIYVTVRRRTLAAGWAAARSR